MIHIVGFCLVMMLGFLIEATLGFGGTVIALPLCSMLVGIHTAVPAVTAIVCLASLIIVIQDWKHMAWKPYAVMMAFMLLGMPVGMLIYFYFPEKPLKIILGLFTVFVAVKGLITSRTSERAEDQATVQNTVPLRYYICLLLGGIIHGAFSCGGVLTVMYANRAVTGKKIYRVTLSAIWFSLNVIITVKNIVTGEMTSDCLRLVLFSLPFVATAIFAGNFFLKKLNTAAFVKAVYGMLFISGFLMVVQAVI